MKDKFTSIDLKSFTPINIFSTGKIFFTKEMIHDGVTECASCNMVSTDYNYLKSVNIAFQPSESQEKINLTANHPFIEESFKINVKNSRKITREMLKSNIVLTCNINTNVSISLSKQ